MKLSCVDYECSSFQANVQHVAHPTDIYGLWVNLTTPLKTNKAFHLSEMPNALDFFVKFMSTKYFCRKASGASSECFQAMSENS